MQKDLTQGLLQTGHQTPHVSLLDTGTMEQMGKDLVQLCDRLEEHGLVDYQMGVWEEEILSGKIYFRCELWCYSNGRESPLIRLLWLLQFWVNV